MSEGMNRSVLNCSPFPHVELVQKLNACTILAEDSSSVPRTQVR